MIRPTLSCRFYEEKFPELHEAVNTNVTEIGEMGAYVKLLEYNNVGGKSTLIAIDWLLFELEWELP